MSNPTRLDMKAAGREFRKSVEISPSYDAANSNLGAYYLQFEKNPEKALYYFQQGARVNTHAAFHRDNVRRRLLGTWQTRRCRRQLSGGD